MEIKINREFKNSVFMDMFAQENYRLQLFQAIHPEMTDITVEDIKLVTLKQVITNHLYNDLAIQVRDRLMVFVEAQSTWSINVVLRILLYLADTIQTYLHENEIDIHDRKKIELPVPEFYIIYTGSEKAPGIVSLKKDFYLTPECPVDLEAKVLNAETDDIIGQYIIFCHVFDEQIKKHGRAREAAIEAIRICRDRGVFIDYLKEREKEVINNMIMLFDQEYAVEQFGKSQRAEGAIIEAIKLYHDEMHLSPAEIVTKIMARFNLSKTVAEKYVEETLDLQPV